MTPLKTAFLVTFVAFQWACGGAAASPDARAPSALSEKRAESPPVPASLDQPEPTTLDAQRYAAVTEEPENSSADGGDSELPTDGSADESAARDADADADAGEEGPSAEKTKTKAIQVVPLRAVEASIHLDVESIDAVRASVQKIVGRVGGRVSHEQASIESWQKTSVITLRVPVEKTEEVLQEVETLGRLTHRNIASEDISKEYFDARLRLRNLHATLERYQQLLAQAEGVEQMLPLEKEMARIRLQIEELQGTLAFLRDRGLHSTIVLQLFQATEHELAQADPEPRFFPGARLGGAFDLWRPGDGEELSSQGFFNVGLSLGFDRQFTLDIDLLLDPARSEPGVDGGVITLGGHFYSEFLGDGEATWMEPSIGLRAGYSLIAGRHEFTAGGGLGIDVYKNDLLRLVLEQRFGVLAGAQGVHALYQPTLGFSVGF